MSLQGQGWKIVASFEGVMPKKMKALPLDQMFEVSSVKKVLLLKSPFIFGSHVSMGHML